MFLIASSVCHHMIHLVGRHRINDEMTLRSTLLRCDQALSSH